MFYSNPQNRIDRLTRNPHNISGIAGCPPLTLHAFTAARFEREGYLADTGALNPYRSGTMAADRWQAGFDHAARQRSEAESAHLTGKGED